MKQMKTKMKEIKRLLIIGILAILASACTKDMFNNRDLLLFTPGEKHTIIAEASLPTADKAYLSGNDVLWEVGDSISINGKHFTTYEGGSTTAVFYGDAFAMLATGAPSGSEHAFWAVYPTNLAPDYTSGIPRSYSVSRLIVEMPAVQTFDINKNALKGYNYMVGYAQVPADHLRVPFQMRNLCAVLKVHINAAPGVTINKMTFRSDNSKVAGALKIEHDAVNDTIRILDTATASDEDKLVVSLKTGNTDGIDISSGADIYVLLPPMANKNLKMRVFRTDGNYHEVNKANTTLLRNHIYTTTLTGNFDNHAMAFYTPYGVLEFAPANLQFNAVQGSHRVASGGTKTGTWRFAPNQWDIIGSNNNNIASNYNGWIDLFGWATSGWDNTANDSYSTNFEPWSAGSNVGYGPDPNGSNRDINGTWYDWGEYNEIYNPKTGQNDPPGTWRTPTNDEMMYLWFDRPNAANLRGHATVNGIEGFIILHESFVLPSGLSFTPDPAPASSGAHWYEYGTLRSDSIVSCATNYYSINTYNTSQWTSMEKAGAFFLPASGIRSTSGTGATAHYSGYSGGSANVNSSFAELHTATHYEGNGVTVPSCYIPYVAKDAVNNGYSHKTLAYGQGSRNYGRAVRLVRIFQY